MEKLEKYMPPVMEKEPGSMYKTGQGNERPVLQFAPGDRVLVMEGVFEGSIATVSQTKKDILKITVQMFGRQIPVEVSAWDVNKIK